MESILCGAKNYMKLFCWGLSCGRKLSWKKMGNIDGPKILLEFFNRVDKNLGLNLFQVSSTHPT